MKRWLRRLAYLLFFLVWLVVMSFPMFAFFLATNGEIQLGNDPRRHVRFFLLQETDTQGIGVEWIRPLRENDTCSRGSIRYLLWEGKGQNIDYCQCYDATTGDSLASNQDACHP